MYRRPVATAAMSQRGSTGANVPGPAARPGHRAFQPRLGAGHHRRADDALLGVPGGGAGLVHRSDSIDRFGATSSRQRLPLKGRQGEVATPGIGRSARGADQMPAVDAGRDQVGGRRCCSRAEASIVTTGLCLRSIGACMESTLRAAEGAAAGLPALVRTQPSCVRLQAVALRRRYASTTLL